jgi:Protein of unknown function (DUF3641)
MANLPALTSQSEVLTIDRLLPARNIDLFNEIQTESYCYGCTAGCGSNCDGALV